MAKYPIYLEIGGRRVVVIGGGGIAFRKVEVLYNAGALVSVVAREFREEFSKYAEGGAVELIRGEYSREHLGGAVLVIAATDDNELNSRIYSDCREGNIICNVVDVPELCDFYVPATVKRGPLHIAIGTDGKSPAYSGKIRRRLEKEFSEVDGEFVEVMGEVRKRVIAEIDDEKRRKEIFGALITDESYDIFVNDGADKWREFAEGIIGGR
mgnify:CR=1 FL=1